MPSTNVVRGNLAFSALVGPTLSPISVAPNTAAEQTFTVTGLQVGDFVNVMKPTTQAGLAIGNARVSAANTLAIAFINATAATITPTASEIYQVAVDRPESTPLPATIA
jgi:hypothetical protein